MNPFHAAESTEQRSAAEVFASSSTQQASGIASRFASSGKFTHQQLETGEDEKQVEAAPPADAEFDPNDKRSLYERLQAQRDEKQADFDHKHTFKNQMDHWRLDENEAAFEEERMAGMRKQEVERERLHEEGAQFYKLARTAARNRTPRRRASAAILLADRWWLEFALGSQAPRRSARQCPRPSRPPNRLSLQAQRNVSSRRPNRLRLRSRC